MKIRNKALLLIVGFLVIFGGFVGYKILTTPQNLRFSSDSVQPRRMFQDYKRCTALNMNGLREANFSGSGSLVIDHLKAMRKGLNDNLRVINGTGEQSQTTFYNGRTLYFLCMDCAGDKVSTHNVRKGLNCYAKRFISGTPIHLEGVQPANLSSEAEVMKELGIPYTSIFPVDFTSKWDYMDELIGVFEKVNPSETHVLFHCTRGQGRTTTLMVLYDIFRNHKEASFDDIVDRQYCLGGEDLMDTTHRPKGTWKHEALVNRKHLVRAFYDYMSDTNGYNQVNWDQWLYDKAEEGYAYIPVESDKGSPYRQGTRT